MGMVSLSFFLFLFTYSSSTSAYPRSAGGEWGDGFPHLLAATLKLTMHRCSEATRG